METYTEQFNILDDFLIAKGIIKRKRNENKHIFYRKKKAFCCLSPNIRRKEFRDTCLNCGLVATDDIEIYEEDNSFCSPPMKRQYNNRTFIKGIMKNSAVNRIHTWTNNFYDETELDKSFREIDKYKNVIEKDILDRAKYHYKVIYIDKKISSRSLIREGIYMYCIYLSHIELKKEIEFIELMRIINKNMRLRNKRGHILILTIKNYNNAVKKIDGHKIFYHKDLDKLYEKYRLKLNNYKKKDLIRDFNKYKSVKKRKKNKTINDRSLLIGLIYKNLKDELIRKEYAREINISILTLIKVLNKIN